MSESEIDISVTEYSKLIDDICDELNFGRIISSSKPLVIDLKLPDVTSLIVNPPRWRYPHED